jgi:hypothetical protein
MSDKFYDDITATKVPGGHLFSFWSTPSQQTVSFFFEDGKEPAYVRHLLPKNVSSDNSRKENKETQ